MHAGLLRESQKGRGQYEDIDVPGDLAETRWGGMDWTDMAQGMEDWRAFVNAVINLRFCKNVGKFLNGLMTGDFRRRTQLIVLFS
jgi:hypothetical protein